MTKRTRSKIVRGRGITPAVGRAMARARWDRYHATAEAFLRTIGK